MIGVGTQSAGRSAGLGKEALDMRERAFELRGNMDKGSARW